MEVDVSKMSVCVVIVCVSVDSVVGELVTVTSPVGGCVVGAAIQGMC